MFAGVRGYSRGFLRVFSDVCGCLRVFAGVCVCLRVFACVLVVTNWAAMCKGHFSSVSLASVHAPNSNSIFITCLVGMGFKVVGLDMGLIMGIRVEMGLIMGVRMGMQ